MSNDKNLRFITVIEGFYYSNSYYNQLGHPFVDTRHLHDYRVTGSTFHTTSKRLLRTCTVLSPFGKRQLVITAVYHAKSSLSKHLASLLRPVINFRENGMRNPQLTQYVRDHSDVQLRIDEQAVEHEKADLADE